VNGVANFDPWARAAYYLVIDLEATTSEGGKAFPPHEMETIEIGAVLVRAATLEPIDEHQTFVRPVRHPVLLAFCMELTGIRQDMVDGAPLFHEAFAAMRVSSCGARGVSTTRTSSGRTASGTACTTTCRRT
jgi:inhibitor of KinA sporulation pathway (predicted exonuclease)